MMSPSFTAFHRRGRAGLLRRAARPFVLLTAAAAAACSDPVAASSVDIRFEVTGEVRAPATNSGDATATTDAANAAAGAGTIVVLGRILLPSPCFLLTPEVSRTGSSLDVVISARDSSSSTCAAYLVARSYSLRIASLERGTYRLRVVHEVEGPATTLAAVLDKSVVVE